MSAGKTPQLLRAFAALASRGDRCEKEAQRVSRLRQGYRQPKMCRTIEYTVKHA